MNETLEYIDAYFQQQLNDKEKSLFEERCIRDEAFAGEVAFYITSREAVRQKLLEQKKGEWSGNQQDKVLNTSETLAPVRKLPSLKWMAYAAAACIVLAVATYFFYPAQTTQRLAHTYVENDLSHISPTMDGSRDSLQKGIGLYNEKKYDTAFMLFQAVYSAHPDNSDAKQYTGLVYLMKKEYDKALVQFDELAGKKLFSNRGPFLKAVTLFERNKKGDKEAAKKLLEQVRDQHLEDWKVAEAWLKKW